MRSNNPFMSLTPKYPHHDSSFQKFHHRTRISREAMAIEETENDKNLYHGEEEEDNVCAEDITIITITITCSKPKKSLSYECFPIYTLSHILYAIPIVLC